MSSPSAAQPKVSSQCISDFILDEIVLGNSLTPEAKEHFTCCSRCSERLSLFRASKNRSSAVVEQLLLSAKTRSQSSKPQQTRTSWLTWPRLAFASSFCALAVLLVTTLGGTPNKQIASNEEVTMPADGIRIKGTAVRLFRNRDGNVTEARAGDAFRSGDALRFSVTCGNAGYFFLIGVEEGSGHIAAYHPYQGKHSIKLGPGVDIPLPGSLVLDDSAHTEYFIALFSQDPFALEDLERSLAEGIRSGETIATAIENLSFAGTFHSFAVKREP